MGKLKKNVSFWIAKPFYHFRYESRCVFLICLLNFLQVTRSVSIAKKYQEYFRNPLDDVDGAARVLDPVRKVVDLIINFFFFFVDL